MDLPLQDPNDPRWPTQWNYERRLDWIEAFEHLRSARQAMQAFLTRESAMVITKIDEATLWMHAVLVTCATNQLLPLKAGDETVSTLDYFLPAYLCQTAFASGPPKNTDPTSLLDENANKLSNAVTEVFDAAPDQSTKT